MSEAPKGAGAPRPTKPLFDLGKLVATPGALELLERFNVSAATLLDRHVTGDWGDLGAEDKSANDFALAQDTRIFSSYKLSATDTVWIITEADRSSTCVLRPSDY
jgi:hypothetical protein